jgi:hypothetical protein
MNPQIADYVAGALLLLIFAAWAVLAAFHIIWPL